MWNPWSDFDRTYSALDELRRRMDYVFGDLDRGGTRAGFRTTEWPTTDLTDEGERFTLQALVPGVTEGDLEITATADTITVAGERKSEAPEGYSVHRRERPTIRFSRSYTLPGKIDPGQVNASMENGVLTIQMDKAPESRPRQINVKASSSERSESKRTLSESGASEASGSERSESERTSSEASASEPSQKGA